MIHICGRKLKVKTGTKSQTINVCSPRNIHGEYDYRVRLRPPFISESTLLGREWGSIIDVVQYLVANHFGEVEQAPSTTTTPLNRMLTTMSPLAGHPAATDDDVAEGEPTTEWELNAVLAAEQSIDRLILEFIESPYLHRVEHSIHSQLFSFLKSNEIFSCTCPMGRWQTQLIHKEWPEFLLRPDKGKRRGNFDISVLSPQRLKSCRFADFREGRIQPSIVVELGLDYRLPHLAADAAKLKNSRIQNSYLVHLVRQEVDDDFANVEQFLLNCGIKTSYARITSSQVFYKLVNDKDIRTHVNVEPAL